MIVLLSWRNHTHLNCRVRMPLAVSSHVRVPHFGIASSLVLDIWIRVVNVIIIPIVVRLSNDLRISLHSAPTKLILILHHSFIVYATALRV
jgi:hypothetical protein